MKLTSVLAYQSLMAITSKPAEARATTKLFNYADDACTTPGIPAVVEVVARLEFPEGTVTTPLGEARFVNTTITGIKWDGIAPPATNQAALEANGAFETEYDLILVVDSTLYGGDISQAGVGDSAETRATTLDTESAFMRL